MKPKVQGAAGPVNTLGGTNSYARPPKRAAVLRTPVDPPSAKKLKTSIYTEARLAPKNFGSMISSRPPRSSQYGSQDGMSTMDNMGGALDTTALPSTRSNRRRRSENGSQSPALKVATVSRPFNMPPGRDDIVDVDDADELANGTTEPQRRNRPPTAQVSKVHVRIGADGADVEFMAPKSGANTTKKRLIHTDDDDELGDYHQAKKSVVGTKAREVTVRKTGGLASRADISSTTWSKEGPESMQLRPRLVSAICCPRYIYSGSAPLGSDEDSPLYFEPGDDGVDLYACTTEGQQALQSRWLKITRSTVRSITYNPDSPYIKVMQRASQREDIGASLLLKFADKDEASEVATWARTKLDLMVTIGTAETLARTHQKGWDEVATFNKNKKTPPKVPAAPSAAPNKPIVITEADGVGFRHDPPNMPTPRPQPFRDRVQETRQGPAYNAAEQIPELPSTRRSTRSSGNTCNPIPVEDPEPEPEITAWSKQNTDWEKNWEVSLNFQRTTVEKEDIQRLDEGECLNDNLIGFLMRFIFDLASKSVTNLANRVYVHNTFFYTTLKSGGRSYHHINYDGVKNWTSKVDLLSYDYVIVPVNEHFHWWLAIICNPGKLDPDAREQPADDVEDSSQTPKDESEISTEAADPGPSADLEMVDATDPVPLKPGGSPTAELALAPAEGPKNEGDARHVPATPRAEGDNADLVDIQPAVSDLAASEPKPIKKGRKSGGPPPRVYDIKDPRIITLDSLGGSHTPAVASLKTYLAKEFEHKRGKVLENLPAQLGMKAIGLPEQDNFNDCGVYLLAYFREFVLNPDQFVKKLLHKEKTDWKMDPAKYRTEFRDTIFREQKIYQDSLGRGKATHKIPVKTPSKSPVKAAGPAPSHAVPPAQKSPAAPQPQKPPKTKPSLPPARSPGQSSRTLRPSSSPPNPPGAGPENDAPSGDEVMLLQPAKDVAVASVEPVPPPAEAPSTDEVTFLKKLPDSSPPPRTRLHGLRPSPMAKKDQQQPKPATAAPPRTTQAMPSRLQTRSLQNSPAAAARAQQPTMPLHKSPFFSKHVPVVRNCKMVTSSDDDKMMAGKIGAIDLTEEEGKVKARKKEDASIDLTLMD